MSDAAWEFEHSVECAASRALVWAFWTDVSNWQRLEGDAVEWIRLEGPFVEGTHGATKTPGEEPRHWIIAELDSGISATIELSLGETVFSNRVCLNAMSNDRTQITQRMWLEGPGASELAEIMQGFESTAPQGLARLASAIEAASDVESGSSG